MQNISPTITYRPILHKGQNRIAVYFEYQQALVKRIKQNKDARWSNTLKCWHLPDTEQYRIKCKLKVEKTTTPNVIFKQNKIAIINQDVIPTTKQLLILKAYSPSTQKTYLAELAIFLADIQETKASTITETEIKLYLQNCITVKQLSENTVHSRLNALKFYYEQVLKNKKLFYHIPRPKKHLQLPKVINEAELKRLFASANNIKHKAILFVAYSAGLRVSEIINLRLQDIDREREQLFIHCSKGKKDRYVRLSPLVLEILEQYYKISKPKPTNYLFEGLEKGKPYTIRSAQQIFSDCKHKAGIIKSVSFHSLRHSFATHILEKGIDVSYIKEILGHFNINTTLRYLHVRKDFLVNIESPIDSLYKNG